MSDETGKALPTTLMTNPRILVVESARAYQNVLREIAMLVGVECMFTDRIEAALVAVEREAFDLFVVATYLPDGHGAELASACRASPRHAATPFLLITSNDPATLTADVIGMGVTEVIRRSDLVSLRRHFAECVARGAAGAKEDQDPEGELEDRLTGVHSRAFFDHLAPMAIG